MATEQGEGKVEAPVEPVVDKPKRRSWKTRFENAAKRYAGFDGPWVDVGEGACECGTERRLYSPITRPEVKICSPCTQRGALAAIPNESREEE